MSTHGQPASATTAAMPGSASPPETSLTTLAPAASAASATSARVVSMLIGTPAAASARITGSTRPDSVAGVDPLGAGSGRLAADVDQVGAVGAHAHARGATAASRSAYRPPSEKLSGVTLSTPMTTGAGASEHGHALTLLRRPAVGCWTACG